MDKIGFSVTNNYNYRIWTFIQPLLKPLRIPPHPILPPPLTTTAWSTLRIRVLTYLEPPQLSGPDDPDADVQVAADGADFPSVVKCLQLCKLPYDGSANWQDLEGKDVLRAVRRFRLRFPAVSWTFAEDYIFTVFGKKKSEKTRGGKRSENNKAEKIGLPNPHTFRPQKNSKASKAAAAAAVATAEEVCFLVS